MSYTQGNSVGDTGANSAFVQGKFEHIFAQMQEVKRPKFLWRDAMPEESYDGGIDPFADAVSYRVRDVRGRGGFIGATGENINTAGFTYFKRSFKLHTSGIKFNASFDDIGKYRMGMQSVTGMNDIFTEFGQAAGIGAQSHIDSVVFFGDADAGYQGLIDYPDVPVAVVALGASGFTQWDTKTPDEILADLANAVSAVIINTGQTFIPNLIELPLLQYNAISSLKSGNVVSPNTIMKFFLENNPAIQNGRTLTIRPNRYLAGAGAGGTDRMRIITNDSDLMILPLPQWPALMLEPQQRGFTTEVFMRYVFGQPIITQPLSQRNVDGI